LQPIARWSAQSASDYTFWHKFAEAEHTYPDRRGGLLRFADQMKNFLFALLLLCTACAPSMPPPPQVVKVYTTAAAQPWLTEASNCAAGSSVILSNVSDPTQADILLRVGEPANLSGFAFQIGREDLLVVTHQDSPLQELTAEQVRAWFGGQGQTEIQVWVYSAGEDLQQVFACEVMRGVPVSSLARLAVSPQQLSAVLNAEQNTLGLLGRHWKTGAVREVFSLPDQPILAITATEPQGAVKNILACLQK